MSVAADTEVLVVGAGPVGLALAGDLGWRDRGAIVIEQSDGSIAQPRQDLVGVRTMEFCRRWGLLDAVDNCPYPRDYAMDIAYVTSITGEEIGREPRPARAVATLPAYSPQKRERCPQNMFDPILRDFACSFDSVSLRYGCRLLSYVKDADGVTATVETGGATQRIRARYLAGCDGAGSTVRRQSGIALEGKPLLTKSTNVLFRCANFNALHDKGQVYRYVLVSPQGVWATMVAINGRENWRFQIVGGAEAQDLTEAEVRALLLRAVGREFDYEILNIMPWSRRELVAASYGTERVFLVGDAAHQMSPTGGFGMNTGIGDAVDLGWKVSAVMEGWGGAALLDTYDLERRPVGLRNVREASSNLMRMTRPVGAASGVSEHDALMEMGWKVSRVMQREWLADGVHIGYVYEDSPIVWRDGTPPVPDDPVVYTPSARPGGRAPHVWLRDGRSMLDLFQRDFVLLRLGAMPPDPTALQSAAKAAGMPLEVIDIDEPEVLDLYAQPLVLVRPDGHVAWRGAGLSGDAAQIVDRVRGACPR